MSKYYIYKDNKCLADFDNLRDAYEFATVSGGYVCEVPEMVEFNPTLPIDAIRFTGPESYAIYDTLCSVEIDFYNKMQKAKFNDPYYAGYYEQQYEFYKSLAAKFAKLNTDNNW